MSYIKHSRIPERQKIVAVLLILFTSALTALTVVGAEEPAHGSSVPQHEDHGNPVPVIQATTASACESGVSSGFPCKNVALMARLPLSTIGGGQGADSWGWKDPQTQRYYALMARSNGTSFIDVTDPVAPVYLGNLPSTFGEGPWRDVKVYSNHAFVVADSIADHGMQVFDLTHLRGVQTPQTFSADALYTGVGPAHNIAINEDSGFAYIVGSDQCAGGLHMVDIRIPKSPVFAGCYSDDGYSHDVQCVSYSGPDQDHQGSETCFASNQDSLTIVDVSNKSSPVMISKVGYPQIAYSHQGWLDESQGLFFMGDEIDELTFGMNTRTLVFDVGDLDNPVYSSAHTHGTTSIDHNMYVRGSYLYQANYLAGLRIFRINTADADVLTEAAYFDTAPDSDELEFAGAWNVYPFFDNGTLLVSDTNSGLFILRTSLDDDINEPSFLNGRLSGAWVSAGLNDQGLMLFVDENMTGPVIFYAWFIFLDGQPFWLTGAAPFEYGQDSVEIPTQRLSGLEFVVPSDITAMREDIGNLSIHVHSCNEIHVDYDFVGLGSQADLVFSRLAGVQGRGCPD